MTRRHWYRHASRTITIITIIITTTAVATLCFIRIRMIAVQYGCGC